MELIAALIAAKYTVQIINELMKNDPNVTEDELARADAEVAARIDEWKKATGRV
jgi:hypothetical protein